LRRKLYGEVRFRPVTFQVERAEDGVATYFSLLAIDEQGATKWLAHS
jgi:hypothetical protein